MLHITRIISLVPRSEGNTKNMVLTAAALADLVKHLQAITDPPPNSQSEEIPSDLHHL
ncbi:hypothetical protein ES708_24678 [subsurface metagenome]